MNPAEQTVELRVPAIRLLHDDVLLYHLPTEQQTDSGLYVPGRRHDFSRFMVVKVGGGKGDLKPGDHMKEGDIVLMRPNLGDEIRFGSDTFVVAKFEQIRAVEEPQG